MPDLDALGRDPFVVHRRLGDLLQHLDAVGDVAEHGVLVVEGRLIGEDDEELGAGAVGRAGHEHRRHRPARQTRPRAAPPSLDSARRFRTGFASRGSFESGSPPCTMPFLNMV